MVRSKRAGFERPALKKQPNKSGRKGAWVRASYPKGGESKYAVTDGLNTIAKYFVRGVWVYQLWRGEARIGLFDSFDAAITHSENMGAPVNFQKSKSAGFNPLSESAEK